MIERIYQGENLDVLSLLDDESIPLIYIDPPFNTGKRQSRTRISSVQSPDGTRVGFAGKRYESTRQLAMSFPDRFEDYLGFLLPRLEEAYRVLSPNGTFYLHIDYREAHYCKIVLDQLFGRECFINEIIWAYDYGHRTTKRWPAKHDTILMYSKDPDNYVFNAHDVDREPYMAPGLQADPVKAELGKLPTDVWWHTIVPTRGYERTGYPTQKPVGIARRIIAASSMPGDTVLDFFAGSGTVGDAARQLGRGFILVDNHEDAVRVMEHRLELSAEHLISSGQ